jgi:precorrin-6B methylase 2
MEYTMAIELYQTLSLLFIAAAFVAVLSIVYASWRNGISPMPSSAPVRQVVADEINKLKGTGVLVEAGSGWGTLALHVAKRCRGWRIIGVENSTLPLWVSRMTERLTRRLRLATAVSFDSADSVTFIRGDLYAYPYEEVDLVVCYLYPGAMKRLSSILEQRLKPGAKVISVCFALPDRQHEAVITCKDLYRTQVYIYNASRII